MNRSIKNSINFKTDFPDLYKKRLTLEGNKYTFIYEEDKFKNALLSSVFCFGCVVGTLIVPLVCDFFGRKRTILFGAAIFGFGSLFAGIITNLILFYITRIIMGIGIGLLSTICPMYIAETAPTEKRGHLITLYQLMITIGIFLAYIVKTIINFFLKSDELVQWRVVLGNQVIPGFILLIMMFFLPYSPRYYIWQERDDDALRIVSKLRGISTTRDPEIQSEFQTMKRSLDIEKHEYSISWSEFLSKPILKRVLMVMGLQALQQFTGINFILSNHQYIFNELNKSANETSLFGYLGYINVFINVIGTLPTFFLIEKWGRKVLLMIGSVGMAFSLAMSSFADYFNTRNNEKNTERTILTYVSISGILLFIFFFASSWGPVIWVYQSEVFPMRVRSKAVAFCSLANWSCFAAIATIYPLIEKSLDQSQSPEENDKGLKFEAYKINLFFALCCFLSLFYVLLFVKETKGVVLENMDTVFESNNEKTKQK